MQGYVDLFAHDFRRLYDLIAHHCCHLTAIVLNMLRIGEPQCTFLLY